MTPEAPSTTVILCDVASLACKGLHEAFEMVSTNSDFFRETELALCPHSSSAARLLFSHVG